MFKNQKIYIKIGFGFSFVMLFLLIISFFSYKGASNSSENFDRYREVAVDNVLLGRIQANLLSAIIEAKSYILTMDNGAKDRFLERVSTMEKLTDEAINQISEPERKRSLEEVESSIENYKENFNEVVTLSIEQISILKGDLGKNGGVILELLDQILKNELQKGNTKNGEAVSSLIKHFLQVRLFVTKYIESTTSADYDKAVDEISVEIEFYLKMVEKSIRSKGNRKKVEDIRELFEGYKDGFYSVSNIINQKKSIIEDVLDKVGPKITDLTEEIKLSIKNEQDIIGPQTVKDNQFTINLVIYVSIAALIFAFIIALLTIKSITKPLNSLVNIADLVSGGEFNELEEIDQADEIGDVYKALHSIIEILHSFNFEFNGLIEAVRVDNYSKRSDSKNFNGGFKEILGNVNNLMEVLEEKINFQKGVQVKERRVSDYQKGEVQKLKEILFNMSKGDLVSKYEVERSDDDTLEAFNTFSEISSLLNSTIESLNDVLVQVKNSSFQVQSASEQVSSASQSLSSGTSQQAASLEQVTSTMQEIGSQTQLNAENANQANNLSLSAKNEAESGNDEMQKLIIAMKDINKSSSDISKIIKVIDEIAFQTNLLALNAAVEAARAGKHGKGFAVVAEEVRNLAARSSKAAKETSELIEDSIKKVRAGTELVDKTGTALEKIVTGATKVTDLVAEIAMASKEQTTGIAQSNTALEQVSNVTQQNASNAEETAAASEEMSSQATELDHQLSRFKLVEKNVQAQLSSNGEFRSSERRKKVIEFKPEDKQIQNPEDIISLSDDNFGKY